MTRVHGNRPLLRYASRIYRALLFVYPSGFRHEFERQMVQAFETSSSEFASSADTAALVKFWIYTMVDLVLTAGTERASSAAARYKRRALYPLAVATALAACTGFIHLGTDADAATLMLLLGGTCACGALFTERLWRLALVAGMGVPIALFLAHGLKPISYGPRDSDSMLPISLLPAFAGAYLGMAIRRIIANGGAALQAVGQHPPAH